MKYKKSLDCGVDIFKLLFTRQGQLPPCQIMWCTICYSDPPSEQFSGMENRSEEWMRDGERVDLGKY